MTINDTGWREGHDAGFAAAKSHYEAHNAKLEAQVERLREEIYGLRTCLEIIGVGDSENPQEDAAETLVELGLWLREAVAAGAHRKP